ncbi:phage late control D family protein [Burkholderia dolosa]|uniref:Phage late control D family protein n=1 Tax=Burkholderia dolosa TaxID=152500 RepID=A0A892IJX7_9BURK|nr:MULTISPECIES: phage late control D family protein [Burkholderia]AKE01758.1 phage late control protein [Burkholderia cepacia]AJY10983.1 phage late control protein [Burkholderia dolosa AU0158]AYZ95825.1 phage late control D family protein [Burkholderia dolosa]EAY71832.1 Phage protein D [Burkholderia dolosa AU0158]MBR8418848.1 phage late control D family protein [Burkholderia dolosa]
MADFVESVKLQTRRLVPQADYRITLDGRDLSRTIAPYLVYLTLSESREDEADSLNLVLDDSRGDLAMPKRGAELKLSIGWVGEPLVDKGTFKIDEFEFHGAPDQMTISARSASMTDAMRERRDKSWHGQTIGEIVKAIAARHKLTPALGDALAKSRIAHIDQTSESDMSFLTRLAKRYDAVMTVKDGRLLFMPIGTGASASGKPLPTLEIRKSKGDSYRYHVSQRESYTSVRARWHTAKKGKRESVIVGGEDNRSTKLLPEIYGSKADAMAAAQAEYARTQRGQATFDMELALGRPDVYPEMAVTAKGFKPEIDAVAWLVKRVVSRVDAGGGFTTSLEMEMKNDPATSRHRTHFRKGGK